LSYTRDDSETACRRLREAADAGVYRRAYFPIQAVCGFSSCQSATCQPTPAVRNDSRLTPARWATTNSARIAASTGAAPSGGSYVS